MELFIEYVIVMNSLEYNFFFLFVQFIIFNKHLICNEGIIFFPQDSLLLIERIFYFIKEPGKILRFSIYIIFRLDKNKARAWFYYQAPCFLINRICQSLHREVYRRKSMMQLSNICGNKNN